MNRLTQINQIRNRAVTTLTLDYDARTKSRLKVLLDDGTEAGLFLERGTVLRQGDLLSNENGFTVEVLAAKEAVSTLYAPTEKHLLLACYHLGNRHVSLQIGDGWLRYQQDHVLDEMVQYLGLTVKHEMAAFSPESGAYQAGGHHHQPHGDNHVH